MEVRLGLVLFFLTACLGSVVAKEPTKQERRPTIHELSLEVAALQSIYDFQFSEAQLQMLAKLAPQTREDDRKRARVRVTREFEAALTSLRDALANPVDEDRMAKALEAYAKFQEQEDPDLDDLIEITDAAKEKAIEVLKGLPARQLASFIAGFGEEFPDPVDDLKEAIGKVRQMNDDQWKILRRVIGQSIGDQAAGLDAEKAAIYSDAVVQILIQARSFDDKTFEREKSALEKKAHELFKDLGPMEVIRNTTEVALATLLSNPRLEAAVKARLEAAAQSKLEAKK
jgi:hypothetical protein